MDGGIVSKQETVVGEQNRLRTLLHSFKPSPNHDGGKNTGKHGNSHLPHNTQVEYSSVPPTKVNNTQDRQRLGGGSTMKNVARSMRYDSISHHSVPFPRQNNYSNFFCFPSMISCSQEFLPIRVPSRYAYVFEHCQAIMHTQYYAYSTGKVGIIWYNLRMDTLETCIISTLIIRIFLCNSIRYTVTQCRSPLST